MKLSTLFVLLGMIVISFYGLIEVSYYASAQQLEQNSSNTPYLEIPLIGIDQPINNISIDYGIYYDPESAKPGAGTVAIFGHRTFRGSPFLNLNKLQLGDNISIDWPGIGDVEYQVLNSTIVPASYRLSIEQGNVLFLITCYPLGSDKERLMIEAKQLKIYPLQKHMNDPTDDQPYAISIILGFFALGTLLSYLYPVKEDRYIVFIVTIAITIFLILGYFFPSLSDFIQTQLSWANNIFGG